MAEPLFKVNNSGKVEPLYVGKPQTLEEKSQNLGAIPGKALTPDQLRIIRAGGKIDAGQRTLEEQDYKPVPVGEGSPFLESGKQEMKNVGAGILRAGGELVDSLGFAGARKFLDELEVSQNIDIKQTEQATEGAPVQSFLGGVAGGTLALPIGGGGTGVATKLITGAGSGALGGALSSAGTGEDATGIATEAGIGGLFGSVAEAIPALLKARKAAKSSKLLEGASADSDFITDTISNVEKATKASESTGIKLLPAQKTLDPFQTEMTAFLGQNPEVSRKAFKTLAKQNEQAAKAVSDLLGTIATPEQFASSPGMGRIAAKKIVDNAKAERASIVRPLYKKAFDTAKEEGFAVDTGGVKQVINDLLADLPETGKIRSTVLKAKALIGNDTDLNKLQKARWEIDELIETGSKSGNLGQKSVSYLTKIRSGLTDAMREFEPFAKADDKFAELSPAVEQVKNGIFGRIQDLKDKDLKRVSAMIFDPTEINSKDTVSNAVKSLKGIDGGDEIARGLLRVELEKRMSKLPENMSEMLTPDDMKNVPSQLKRAIFGNAKQTEMLMTALTEIDPKAAKNAIWLKESLDRASRARPGGSQTGVRNVITDKLRGPSIAIRDFFRKPIASLTEIGEEAAYSSKVRAVGDALYNPDWSPDLDRIKKLNPNSLSAQSEFEKLLHKIEKVNASGARTQAAAVGGRQSQEDEQ